MSLSTFVDTCAPCLLCLVHFCGHLRALFVIPCPLLWTLARHAYYALSTFVDTCAHAYYALSTFVDTSASTQLATSGKVKNSLVKWYLTRVF